MVQALLFLMWLASIHKWRINLQTGGKMTLLNNLIMFDNFFFLQQHLR